MAPKNDMVGERAGALRPNDADRPGSIKSLDPGMTGVLERDCENALQSIRQSLIELYAAIGVDPSTPQHVSRKFGLNKNLTWKLSKIINSHDPFSAIPHLPGAAGVDIAMRAMRRGGAPEAAINRVLGAIEAFDRAVSVHAGSREDLDLILDSMGLSDNDKPLEVSRELAFRGNSGICGVQAKARVVAGFVSPREGSNGELLNAFVAGFVDVRLLRPRVKWPLFRYRSSSPPSISTHDPSRYEPLFDESPEGCLMIKPFSSAELPQIETGSNGDIAEYMLSGGLVGNLGSFDCFFGHRAAGSPGHQNGTDNHGEFATVISVPTAQLLFDLFIHRDIPMSSVPEVFVYHRLVGSKQGPLQTEEDRLLPLRPRLAELPGSPPGIATPVYPRYPELYESVVARLGRKGDEFRGLRLSLAYPPVPSSVVIRWPLDERVG